MDPIAPPSVRADVPVPGPASTVEEVAAERVRLGPMAHGGETVARSASGRVVFVSGGIPGEEVTISWSPAATGVARADAEARAAEHAAQGVSVDRRNGGDLALLRRARLAWPIDARRCRRLHQFPRRRRTREGVTADAGGDCPEVQIATLHTDDRQAGSGGLSQSASLEMQVSAFRHRLPTAMPMRAFARALSQAAAVPRCTALAPSTW